MSRIISENYSIKLQSIIDEFEISNDLTSLIDFFLDEVQKDQKRKGNRNQVFSVNEFEKLDDLKKSEKLKRLFAYINRIIESFTGQYLHIHINKDLSEKHIDNLITLIGWERFTSSIYDVPMLNKELAELVKKMDLEIILADGNGHHANRLRRERYGWRHKTKLIQQILTFQNATNSNGVLLNMNSSSKNSFNLSEFSEFNFFLNSYVNFGNSLQDIYDNNNDVLKTINTILNLFPSERGQNIWYHDFIKQNIDSWNQLPEFNFSKVINITSGEKTPEALLEMQRQNKFQTEEVYTIFSFELSL